MRLHPAPCEATRLKPPVAPDAHTPARANRQFPKQPAPRPGRFPEILLVRSDAAGRP
ncbi:hypothetical protein CT19431_70014 [Cupriavidus taiwanensis]|nr:hypothetical protein CT19431_70014 [Cupriavidus taiwanensis]